MIFVLSILELITTQLIAIWFILGAVLALICSLFSDSMILQIFIFIVSSILALIFTKPLVKKLIFFKKEETNVGMYIGKIATVTQQICNEFGQGQVNVDGSIWSARSIDHLIIEQNEKVLIKHIEGVKLIVEKIK